MLGKCSVTELDPRPASEALPTWLPCLPWKVVPTMEDLKVSVRDLGYKAVTATGHYGTTGHCGTLLCTTNLTALLLPSEQLPNICNNKDL